jgi:hypothetical protein
MDAKSACLLAEPRLCSHIVYPYTDEAHVTKAICLFASAGLLKNEAVVLVMTKAHRDPIKLGLEAEGFHVGSLEDTGQLACLDAEDLMRRFMIGGMPDPVLFKNVIGMIVIRARMNAGSPNQRPVRIFGEMVSLLWRVSVAAAERVEQLWNEVIDTYSVTLLCTYTLDGVLPGPIPQSLVAPHSHNLAAD